MHERYIYKNGKKYGPFLYETKRVDGKVVNVYIGRPEEKSRSWLRFFSIFILIGLVVLLFVFFFYKIYYGGNITGTAVLNIDEQYSDGEVLSGTIRLNLKAGEFIPSDSRIILGLGNQTREAELSSVVDSPQKYGEYYVENTELSGSGSGYGLAESSVSPEVEFEILVSNAVEETPADNETETSETEVNESAASDAEPDISETLVEETPADTLSDSALAGGVVGENEYIISGKTSSGSPFSYTLELGQTASIVPGSVKVNGSAIPDNSVSLDLSESDLKVSTNYSIAGQTGLTLSIDLSRFGIYASPGEIDAQLIYNNLTIAQGKKGVGKASDSAIDNTNNTKIAKITTARGRIRLGEPVKWVKNVTLESSGNAAIELPKEAENIEVKKIEDGMEESISPIIANVVKEIKPLKFSFASIFSALTGRVVDNPEQEASDSLQIILNDSATDYSIEYETPGPTAVEEETETGKVITISAADELNYTDVVAYTNIPELYNAGQEDLIKIYWRESGEYIPFDAYDLDSNGKIDYLEWIVPHLSNQTFEIILIVKAEHLDSNRIFLEDVYEIVKTRDYNYSLIPDGDYLRVRFERNLTKGKDITIYAKGNNAEIGVYEKDGSSEIARFYNISEDGTYKIVFENELNQDTFDLLSFGDVEYDYVVDPQANVGSILHQCGTLDSPGIYTLNQSITATGSCIRINSNDVWIDGAGYTITGDGTGTAINASGAAAGDNGFGNLTVKNINVVAFSVGIESKGISAGGQFTRGHGGNFTIINATINGNILSYGGSIAAGYGGNAGLVYAYNSTINGNILSYGGASMGEAAGHGANILLSNVSLTGNINVTGGSEGAGGGPGNAGHINISDSIIIGNISANGGATPWGFSGLGYGGNITLINTNISGNIDAFAPGDVMGGSAGKVIINGFAMIGNINNHGAAQSGAMFVNSGDINITGMRYFIGNITSYTGQRASLINIINANFSGSIFGYGLYSTGNGGSGSIVYIQDSIVNLTNSVVNISKADGTIGYGTTGSLTINYSSAFIDTNAKYGSDLKLRIINSSAGEIQWFDEFVGTSISGLAVNVSIRNNTAYVNSDSITALNKSANITFYGLSTGFVNPKILRNSVDTCNETTNPSCWNFTSLNAGLVMFNVTSWTNYSIAGDDATAPLVSIIRPQNITYLAGNFPVPFNFTLNENGTCMYSLDSGANNITMQGNESALFGTGFNATNNSMADGSYTARAYCNDTYGNKNYTEFVVFSVDRTPPIVTINSPAATTYTTSSYSINIAINESGTCLYSLNGGGTNSSLTANSTNTGFTGSVSGASNGNYVLNAYCNDSAGNVNNTANVSFAINVESGCVGSDCDGGGGDGGCTVRSWTCGDWSQCINGAQNRSCESNCYSHRTEIQNCSLACTGDYICGDWSQCINNNLTRQCTDASCGANTTEYLLCNADCNVSISCDGWSDCDYITATSEVISGTLQTEGVSERLCSDTNGCAANYSERMDCVKKEDVSFGSIKECDEDYIGEFDSSGTLLSKIKVSSLRENKLDIIFSQGRVIYCANCYNKIQDGNETGVDCGGECKPCLSSLCEEEPRRANLLWLLVAFLAFILCAYTWRRTDIASQIVKEAPKHIVKNVLKRRKFKR